MKLKYFIFLLLILLSFVSCTIEERIFDTEVNQEPDKINNQEEATQGGDDIIDGLDEVTNNLDEIEDITK